jgi:uncharacterized oligopeptide transporter (OPT) family protein
MAATVQAIFAREMNWSMMGVGVLIALLTLIADGFLKKRNIRLSVLAIALGIYLPLTTTTSLILGGLVSFFANHRIEKKSQQQLNPEIFKTKAHQKGLLLACGLVAGAAVMGVVLAIPFVIAGSTDVLRLVPNYPIISGILAIATMGALCLWMVKYIARAF